MQRFFWVLILFCGSFAYNEYLPVLGPNIEYGIFGAAAPAEPEGAFVPKARADFEFSWIEPLGADYYGVWVPNKTNYMRFFAGAELSPFYGTINLGLGFAPFPPPFAILELRFVYSNENLFWSDVEMPMKQGEQPYTKDIWNAGYMFDRFYERSSYAQIQSFDVQLGGRYDSRFFSVFFLLSFSFIDITSDYEKKSFDYMRGFPLYSRDYVSANEISFIYYLSKNFSWGAELFSMYSGWRYNDNGKEWLYYNIASTGPIWKFNNGRSQLSLNAGFFTRGSDKSFDDPIKERILLSAQYKRFWNFGFGK